MSKASENNKIITYGDYSEGGASMHFSKKSFTLHCTVIHHSDEPKDNTHAYHFSDVMKHNWAQTKCVEIDVEKVFFADQQIIRKKTDNCSSQYKCKWTSRENMDQAISSEKTIMLLWFLWSRSWAGRWNVAMGSQKPFTKRNY